MFHSVAILKKLEKFFPGSRYLASHLHIHLDGDMIKVTYKELHPSDECYLWKTGKRVRSGEVVFTLPRSGDNLSSTLFAGYTHAFTHLGGNFDVGGNVMHYEGHPDFLTACFASFYGRKWKRIDVERDFWVDPRNAKDNFKAVQKNHTIIELVEEVLSMMGIEGMERQIYDSFISTAISTVSGHRLVGKMCPTQMVWPVRDEKQIVCFLQLLSEILPEQPFPICLSEDDIRAVKRSPSANSGFTDSTYAPKKKFEKWPRTQDFVVWALNRILQGESIYDVLPVPGHIPMAKAQVMPPEEDPDKIRIIMTQSCNAELLSDLLSRAMMTAMKNVPWCAVGHSQFDNATFGVFYGLKHPYVNCIDIAPKDSPVIDPPGGCFYVTMDVTALDYSLMPRHFLEMSVSRMLFFDWDSVDDLTAYLFERCFSWEMAFSNVKILEGWGGTWYRVLGIMLSGYKCTSLFDTIVMRYGLLVSLMMAAGDSWAEVLPWLGNIIYGDDCVLRVPMALLPLFSTDGEYPDILAKNMMELGLKLKEAQTYLMLPEPHHKDKLFSHVVGRELRSPGVRFLQNYYVKVDRNGELLHPDHSCPHRVMVWRPFEDYVVKISNHPYSWDHPSGDVMAALYTKAFSLMLSSCANRDAHNLCKYVCLRVMRDYPESVQQAIKWVDFSHEDFRKLGEVDKNLMTSLPVSEQSYLVVLSLYDLSYKGLLKFFPYRQSRLYKDLRSE